MACEKWVKWAFALVIGAALVVVGIYFLATGYTPDGMPHLGFGTVVAGAVLLLLSFHPLRKKIIRSRGGHARPPDDSRKRRSTEDWEDPVQHPWHLSIEEVAISLMVDPAQGLHPSEAARRGRLYGANVLEVVYVPSFLDTFLDEIYEPTQLLLISVGVVYALIGSIGEAVAALSVIVLMANAEIITEWRAKRAVARLRQCVPKDASVLRGARLLTVPMAEVVPGDVVILKAGMEVPADMRLVGSAMLEVQESALTGESVPTFKESTAVLPETTALSERRNVAWAGTIVTRGRGVGIVTATGGQTVLGQVLREVKRQKPPRTPLQRAMKELAGTLTWAALLASCLGAGLGLLRGATWQEVMLTALSLAFATIPEELPILIAGVLAVGGLSLSREGVYVKNLRAQESLAFVDTVVTDKTGTLTENCLVLQDVGVRDASSDADLASLVEAWLYTSTGGTTSSSSSDPFDRAILALLAEEGGSVPVPSASRALPLEKMRAAYQSLLPKYRQAVMVGDRPFESSTKTSAMAFDDGKVYFKGAPEVLMRRCVGKTRAGSKTPPRDVNSPQQPASPALEALAAKLDKLCGSGTRVIGFAVATDPKATGVAKAEVEQEHRPGRVLTLVESATFVGFLAFSDPVRQNSTSAVHTCQDAGVRVVMVTGDHPLTAKAVASKVGILRPRRPPATDYGAVEAGVVEGGVEVCGTSKPLDARAVVYCRATPEDKVAIVRALQAQGHVVAVTGDGVNDAIALAAADVGLAMGRGGTDVARAAAAVVITDDDLTRLTQALREGRRLFSNLRKAVGFYLGAKTALVALFLVLHLPLAPLQIILLELFMDVGASTTFTLEAADRDIMDKPPRPARARFFDAEMIGAVAAAALSLFACVAGAAWADALVLHSPASARQSVCFCAWLVGHVLLAYNMRTVRQPVLSKRMNPAMLVWFLASAAVAVVVSTLPTVQGPLGFVPLSREQWLLIFAMAAATTCWIEAVKLLIWAVSGVQKKKTAEPATAAASVAREAKDDDREALLKSTVN